SPVTALSIKSQSDGKGAKRQFPTNSVLKASTPSIGSPEHHFKTKNSLTPSYGNFAKKGETELSSGPNTSECSTASFYNDGSVGKNGNEDDLENIGVNEIWSGVPPSSIRVRKIVDSQTHLGADLIPMTEQKCQIFYDEPVKASGLKIADVRDRCSYADSSTHGAKSLSPPSDASILSRSQKKTGVRSREFHSSRSSNVNTCQFLNTTSIITDSSVPFDRRPQQVNYSATSSSGKYPVQLHPTMKESRSALSPHEEDLCIVMSDGKGNRVNISLSMLLKSFKGQNGPMTASCITLGSKIIWLKNKVQH
uniref:Breast cancer 2 n=1 Tax=Rhabditophanes sp. KR3021 TaxID=114890 RepID=A0AC35TGW4_9BILA